jgi:hypothetical protein
VIQPESGSVRTGFRRRRTRLHRRNRLIRNILVVAVTSFFVFGLAAVALRHFSPSLFGTAFGAARDTVPDRQQSEASRTRLALANQAEEVFHRQARRAVYPYSVVPGGVEDARELKWVAQHDPIVAAHYAGFDYDHARVVRLVLARTVYLSYRIGNHVYWTRRRVTLHKGEKLITDGKKTARARCGNRVEEVPQQATSSAEPPAWKFEEPLPNFEGTAMQELPVPFQSALNRAPGPETGAPLSSYNPFTGGSWTPISPPPLPAVCAPPKKGDKDPDGDSSASGKKKKSGPCANGGTPQPVPEPGTWLLVVSGLAGMYWQARRKLGRV